MLTVGCFKLAQVIHHGCKMHLKFYSYYWRGCRNHPVAARGAIRESIGGSAPLPLYAIYEPFS